MFLPKKEVKLIPMLLYFSIAKNRWKYLKNTINTVNAETLEPSLPFFFEGVADVPQNDDLVTIFAIVKAEDFSGAWEIIHGKFPVQKVYWTANLPKKFSIETVREATRVFDDMRPDRTDPMMMEEDYE